TDPPRPNARPPLRPLRAGGGRLPRADREAAVPPRDPKRGHERAHIRPRGPAEPARARSPPGPRTGGPAMPGQVGRRPLPRRPTPGGRPGLLRVGRGVGRPGRRPLVARARARRTRPAPPRPGLTASRRTRGHLGRELVFRSPLAVALPGLPSPSGESVPVE